MPKQNTETKTTTPTPTREAPQFAPDRYYQPERLCPNQRQEATRWSMP